MKKKVLTVIITSLFLMILFSTVSTNALNTNSSIKATYGYEDYNHNGGVINISYNAQFVNHPAVARGDGSKNNPYIIENWRVKTIDIEHTDKYFEINHCYIYYRDAIFFNRVNNGKIQDCVLDANQGYYGIELFWSSKNEINDCSIASYIYPLCLKSYSNNNIITVSYTHLRAHET